MADRCDQVESLLTDLRICARNVLRNPTRALARGQLRRACDRCDAFYMAEQSERRFADLDPCKPLDVEAQPLPEGHPAPAARLPYKDD